MTTEEGMALLNTLIKIRDSTYRDAAALRGIADDIINRYKAGDFKPKENCK